MTFAPEEFDGLISAKHLEKYTRLTDTMADAMVKNLVGKISANKDDIVRDLVMRAGSIIQKRVEEISGGNPFVQSAVNTTLNYSKQQLMAIMAQQIAKAQKYL